MSKYVPKLIGVSEFQRKTPAILDEIEDSEQESFIVTHNEPRVVIMSIKRYEKLKALEDLEFIPHRKTSPAEINESFKKTGLYSKEFLDDLEKGLKKSSLY